MVFIQYCFHLEQHCFHIDRQFSCSPNISNWLSRIPTQPSLVIQNSCSSWLSCIISMLWHFLIDSDDLASAPSSSILMNATFLSWFINVVTRNLRISRGGRLLLDGNPKGYEVADHIATKVEVNPQMLSTLKNAKSIWSFNPGGNLETSMVGPLGILVALVKRQIGQGSSNSGRFSGRPSMSPFLAISFSLVIETWLKCWWISWERVCFESPQTAGTTIFLSLWGFISTISIWR